MAKSPKKKSVQNPGDSSRKLLTKWLSKASTKMTKDENANRTSLKLSPTIMSKSNIDANSDDLPTFISTSCETSSSETRKSAATSNANLSQEASNSKASRKTTQNENANMWSPTTRSKSHIASNNISNKLSPLSSTSHLSPNKSNKKATKRPGKTLVKCDSANSDDSPTFISTSCETSSSETRKSAATSNANLSQEASNSKAARKTTQNENANMWSPKTRSKSHIASNNISNTRSPRNSTSHLSPNKSNKKATNGPKKTLVKGNSSSSDDLPTFIKPKRKTPFNKTIKPATTSKENTTQGVSNKRPRKASLSNYDSTSIDDLPTFTKRKVQKSKMSESFKKYGVNVPSLEQILKEQKQLEVYKNQVERAQNLKEPVLGSPITPEKGSMEIDQPRLDCKHLSLEEIRQHFLTNKPKLSSIKEGKLHSERHRIFYTKKKLAPTKSKNLLHEDLKCSTSSAVFTFEQLDLMATLMREEFDPDDINTMYFFQVLIPELCLEIFMITHNMNKRQANQYLGQRIVD